MHTRTTTLSHCPPLGQLVKRFTSHEISCLALLVTTVGALFFITTYTQLNRLLSNGCSVVLHDNEACERESPFLDKPSAVLKNADAQNLNEYLRELASSYRVSGASCAALLDGDKLEMHKSRSLSRKVSSPLTDDFYAKETENCQRFKTGRGYVTSALTEEERDFPIAFSILTFKDAEMVERLLRAIYRPQNFYCIHVDSKAKDSFYFAMTRIAGCFENVFLTRDRVDVIWGAFSVLEPELICMAELWRHRKWKYFINLTGQEFPLKTNLELVRILKSFNGASAIHSTLKSVGTKRWGSIQLPHHIRPVKGPVHIAANRRFVDYVLHNRTALDFLHWTRRTDYPDETFFTSLNFNPHLGIPGSYSDDSDDVANVTLTRYKEWFGQGVRCAAHRFVRGICILTTGDLPLLERSAALFANKFHLDEDRLVIGCLEERLFNNTRDQLSGMRAFNTSFYEKQLFVTHQITAP